MRKSKRREALRDKTVGSRGSGKSGRPLTPPRSEKECLERTRALSARASASVLKRMVNSALGKIEVSPQSITSARLVLEVAGVAKGFTLEMGNDFALAMTEVTEALKETK